MLGICHTSNPSIFECISKFLEQCVTHKKAKQIQDSVMDCSHVKNSAFDSTGFTLDTHTSSDQY